MSNDKDKRKKILLVDDDEIHLLTAELCLKDEYDVYKAKSGDETLKCLRKNEFVPDLIMLDIIMPKMDGWELFGKIRDINGFQNIPILFLTSVDDKEEEKKARDLGAADYITKPLEIIVLKNAITEIFRNKESKA